MARERSTASACAGTLCAALALVSTNARAAAFDGAARTLAFLFSLSAPSRATMTDID